MQNSPKIVVFVAGADFSGTTMLDLILGSANDACSLGEIYPFVTPTSPSHIAPSCSCNKDCGTWSSFKSKKADIHAQLFSRRQHSILIDSSKHPLWIKASAEHLKSQGIESKVVLIWKNPASYAKSCANRGRGTDWARKWINYHQALEETGLPYYSVNLTSLVSKDFTALTKLCRYVGITPNKDMFDYWNYNHHIIFGSATARNQLFQEGTLEKQLTESTSKKITSQIGKTAPEPAAASIKEKKQIQAIETRLSASSEHQSINRMFPLLFWRLALKKYLEIGTHKAGINPSEVSRFTRKLNRKH